MTLAENERLCTQVLYEYLYILQDWKKQFAPQTPDEEPDPRFVESCQMLECTQYLVDFLTEGFIKTHEEPVTDLMKDNKIRRLQERIRSIKEGSNEQN